MFLDNLPLDSSVIDLSFDAGANLSLVLVDVGTINVSITNIDGSFHSIANLAGWALKITIFS